MFSTRKNATFVAGDKVTYTFNYRRDYTEKGIVKTVIDNNFCFVVFNCDDRWDHYYEYTGEHCSFKSLTKGWENI